MKKSIRFAALAALAALLLGWPVQSQDKEKKLPDWRKIGASREFMVQRMVGEEPGNYQFTVLDLVTEFARRAEVSVRYDPRQIGTMQKLTLTGAKDPEKHSLFEYCQQALVAGSMTLLPVPGDARAFEVAAFYMTEERAPLVKQEDLAALSPSEWGTLAYPFKGARPASQIDLLKGLLTQRGGAVRMAPDLKHFLIVDTAANLQRVLEILNTTDVPVEMPKFVNYQRATQTWLPDLTATLSSFLAHYEKQAGLAPGTVYVNWDGTARVLLGVIPQTLAAFVDSAVDAAEKNAKREKDERAMTGPDFVTFELQVPAGRKAARLEASLRQIFEPERVTGDLRSMTKDDEGTAIVIRCRTWLEASVRDTYSAFLK